jgi:PKD repeat protein
MILPATDVNGDPLEFRIVSQPAHGWARVSGNMATYRSEPGYVGNDRFTYAAFDGWSDSNLGTGTVSVAQGPFSIEARALVPSNFPVAWPVPFGMQSKLVNVSDAPTFDWDFGDGSPHAKQQYSEHAYLQPGTYHWTATASVQSGAASQQTNITGTVVIDPPLKLAASVGAGGVMLSWPGSTPAALLEEASSVAPGAAWIANTNSVVSTPAEYRVYPQSTGARFYRLRKIR